MEEIKQESGIDSEVSVFFHMQGQEGLIEQETWAEPDGNVGLVRIP